MGAIKRLLMTLDDLAAQTGGQVIPWKDLGGVQIDEVVLYPGDQFWSAEKNHRVVVSDLPIECDDLEQILRFLEIAHDYWV